MFKKLKEKITEEVKSSPQRFQQLTQSVSDRLQNSATSDENFFSIGEDDANISNTSLESGFTNVSLMSPQEPKNRRNSNSSIASDVSFLPRYESVANMYHLQSDLEISASEIEDNASSSSQLGHLSKEQIYTAFQKAQMRYHKYRGRYTDLARHYKDLERENSKMKSVLVETQDKAIRRVTELKEQCSLEQKAKAHLESALRDEIDEKQFKIQSLQTKIGLLQNGAGVNPDENLETLNKYLTEARQEIENLNERIQEMKANSIIFQTKEQEYKMKITGLEKEISLFSEREKENNLTLAQNKMELHNELLSKDNELSNLKQENEALRKNLEVTTTGKLENLQTQNKKLIDKLEVLTQKCNTYENDLLKMEQYRIELQNANQLNSDLKNQVKEFEEKLEAVRDDAKKSLLSLESKVREKVKEEFEGKEEIMRLDFEKKLEEVTKNESSLKDIQLKLMEKEEVMKKLKEVNDGLLQELALKSGKYNDLEKNHLELIDDSVKLRSKLSNLEKELAGAQNLSQASELKVSRLEESITSLQQQLEVYKGIEEKLELLQKEKDDLSTSLKSNLDQETTRILELLEEERKKSEIYSTENFNLNNQLQNLKQSIAKRDEILEEKTKELELKLEEEKSKMIQQLELSEITVKKLEATSSELSEELKELKTKKEEVILLQTNLENSVQEKNQLSEKLAASDEKLKSLEENIADLNQKAQTEKADLLQKLNDNQSKLTRAQEENKQQTLNIEKLKKQISELNLSLEKQLQMNSALKDTNTKAEELQKTNSELKNELNHLQSLAEQQSLQTQELEEKNTKIESLEQTINDLKTELTTLRDSIKAKEEEFAKNSQLKQEIEETYRSELKKYKDNNKHSIEEINLLKKLLEEANNNLTIKEHEMGNLQEKYTNKQEELIKLSRDIEHQQDLLLKIEMKETELKRKDEQIETLTKKLEQHNDLIEERNDGLFRIFSKFQGQIPNNFKHTNNTNLYNLEEKLQSFEKTFLLEKENLSKILDFLKQFEATYSSLSLERNQLESDKEECLAEIANLRSQIHESNSTKNSIRQLEDEILKLKEENVRLNEQEKKLSENLLELESRNTQVVSDSNFLSEENQALLTQIEEIKLRNEDIENQLKNSNETILKLEEDLKTTEGNQKELLELETHMNELQHEKQRLQEEIQELKIAPVNKDEDYLKEIENLRTKIIQYKSLDLTNRSSIEFYENELEKLKNQNEKLNRKLDETLVTLHHCSELSNSTEIEYLRNVLYNYMLGKESLVLARVIAAVCKFDPQQTETILAKEQQKQTLLGHLGIL